MDAVEEVADTVLRHTKRVLKPVARLCLLSTFMEDGVRMMTQWGEQVEYISRTWRCYAFIAHVFVVINLVLQVGPVMLIMARKHIEPAVFALMFVVVLQTVVYWLFDLEFLIRNFAVIGGLILVLSEVTEKAAKMFAGLPSIDYGTNQKSSYMQFAGRVLVVIMFLTLTKFDTYFRIFAEMIGIVLVLMVAVGFKTKAAAFLLVCLLMIQNVTLNAWWTVSAYSSARDFMKYDFFQTLSVVGGLLLVVALGPGGVSMDERKKEF
eukprot:m.482351 g.482351  ORF g.482351 m.482351 type:complete len:264 (+) comp22514_c0_seq1:188-979(+)